MAQNSTRLPPARKVALLTGASSGVGWATTLLLARENFDLCVTAWNGPALEKLSGQVRALGARCVVIPGDVTRLVDVEKVVHGCLAELGRIDVLINNAAIQAYDHFENYSWDEIEHVNDVNYFGYLRCARVVLPQLRAQKSGVIVNVLSVFEQAGLQYFSIYSASTRCSAGRNA